MIVAAVLRRCILMSFRSLLVVFGSLLVHFLRHSIYFPCYVWWDNNPTVGSLEGSNLNYCAGKRLSAELLSAGNV
jgi:hypothetical protein